MNRSLDEFLQQTADVLSGPAWSKYQIPVLAVAEVIFPRLLRLEEARIVHRTHPLRVLTHLLIALKERPPSETAVLALMISALCHDLAAIPKVTTSDVASAGDKDELERVRTRFRYVHEADGAIHMIQAIAAAEMVLREARRPFIGADVTEISYQVCINHDAPSRRRKLPLDPRTEAGDALSLFVLADGITMIEFGGGLESKVPVGPMVELWMKSKPMERAGVASQLNSAKRSLSSRLQAAFDLPQSTSLPSCFSREALGRLAGRYVEQWESVLA